VVRFRWWSRRDADPGEAGPPGASGASGQPGRPGLAKLVCCALIASVAAGTIGLAVHHDVETTSAVLKPSSLALAIHLNTQELCFYHLIRKELPKGATIYVGNTAPAQIQRLAELSTLWTVPQQTAATAEWEIFLYHASGCSGLGLIVRPL
jgi:hypothetical protein